MRWIKAILDIFMMKSLKIVLAMLAIGLSVSSVAVATPAPEGYTLQPGDILEISVWKEPDLQREVLVRPDGGISFPLVGDVDTTGLTVKGLAAVIKKRISTYIPDPVVTASLKQMMGNRIYVIGKVNKPGEFPIIRNVDVMQALSMAGGINPFGQGDEITILRREGGVQQSIPFDYDDVESGRDLEQNIILRPGDVVVVP
jgi:polysaccharide export outer membrane protein